MISFVILHYKNLKDTIECIESIQHLKTKEQVSIIVAAAPRAWTWRRWAAGGATPWTAALSANTNTKTSTPP
ncbi:MAG: hypothetical protein IJI60_01735, partial [Bacilli bacterium]|nr:hypothetical protein [Bacilli bacterium]